MRRAAVGDMKPAMTYIHSALLFVMNVAAAAVIGVIALIAGAVVATIRFFRFAELKLVYGGDEEARRKDQWDW